MRSRAQHFMIPLLVGGAVVCGSACDGKAGAADSGVTCESDAVAPPNWECLTHLAHAPAPLGAACSVEYKGSATVTATGLPALPQRPTYFSLYDQFEGRVDSWRCSVGTIVVAFDDLEIRPPRVTPTTTECGFTAGVGELIIQIRQPVLGTTEIAQQCDDRDCVSTCATASAKISDDNIVFTGGDVTITAATPGASALCGSFRLEASGGRTMSGEFSAFGYCP